MATLPAGLKATASLDSLYVMGTRVKSNLRDAITSAEISMSTSQVTQLTITLVDNNFGILKSGLFNLGIPVRYKDLQFVVTNVETSSISGNEGITIKCRPETVHKLKNRTGTKVMKLVSPSDFVKSECKAVGAKYYIQPSARRAVVARDKPKAGETYERDERPSSWTTFNRLAEELGFVLFEVAGVIYFGKPTYFLEASRNSPLYVTWNKGGTTTLAETVPTCVKSADARASTVSVQLPRERARECRVGRALRLDGVPYFDGLYLIDSVDYSISSSISRISVSASTAINPEVRTPRETTVVGKDGTIYDIVTKSSKGAWPIDKKYRVGTPFGRRGSWAAGYHTGVDFPAPRGTSVYAVYAGKVTIGGWGSAYGKHVILHVNNRQYCYAHLNEIKVHSGQTVRAGQVLGWVGDTGRAFGTHLHLELRVPSYRYGKDSRNPMPTLGKSVKVTIKTKRDTKYGAGTTNSKRAADFVSWALSRAGSKYVFGATRTTKKDARTFDCSSLVYWALHQVGIRGFPTSTFTQLPYLQRKGKQVSVEQAYRTRGALLYKTTGINHVAISLGNGRTIEAANRQLGVLQRSAKNRGWTHAFLIPGMHY